MRKLISNIHYFIILYAGYYYYEQFTIETEKVNQLKTKPPAIEKKIKRAKRKYKALLNYEKDIEAAKERIEKVAKELEKIQQQLPSKVSDTHALDKISNISKRLNIKDVFLKPHDEQNKGFYYSKKYNLKGMGTFLQFLILLEKLGESDRIFNVRYLQFATSKKKKQKGRFQIVEAKIDIEGYRYNENYKVDRGIDKIESDIKRGATRKPTKKGKKGRRRRGRRRR